MTDFFSGDTWIEGHQAENLKRSIGEDLFKYLGRRINMGKKFWLVIGEESGAFNPGIYGKHETENGAMKDAEDLCLKENRPFYVLTAIAICRPARVEWLSTK